MTGLWTQPIERNQALDSLGIAAVPSSFGEVMAATAEDAWTRNPLPSLLRWFERQRQTTGEAGLDPEGIPPSRILPKEIANEVWGVPGELSFDRDTPEAVARELHGLKRDELARRDVLSRAEGGVAQTAAQLGVGLLASAADPLNVASVFLPAVGPTRAAQWLSRAGESALTRAGTRARIGAIEGAVGAAALEPLVYGVARDEQADYTAADSLLNIAFGTVLGGGLHATAGALDDRISRLPMERREAALRVSVAELAETGTVSRAASLVGDAADPAFAEFDRLFAAPVKGKAAGTLADAPQAREWTPGDPIAPAEARILEGLAAEVEQTARAHRQFTPLDPGDPGAGQGRGFDYSGPVTAVPSERPRWFQSLQAAEKIAPQDLRPVVEKLLAGEILPARQQRLAEGMMARVQEIRAEQVTAMLDARASREAARIAEEANTIGARDADDIALSESARTATAAPAAPLEQRLAAEMERANADFGRLEAAGLITKDSPELKAIAALKSEATALGKAFDMAAFCMGR